MVLDQSQQLMMSSSNALSKNMPTSKVCSADTTPLALPKKLLVPGSISLQSKSTITWVMGNLIRLMNSSIQTEMDSLHLVRCIDLSKFFMNEMNETNI